MDPTSGISSDVHRTLNPTLTLMLRVALYAVAAFSLASTIATLNEVSAFDDLMRTGRSLAVTDLAAAEGLTEGFAQLAFWVGLATGGLTIVWWVRAYQVVAAARPTGRTWSPRWAVGAWFIPLANLVIPKLVLNEIDRIARAAEEGDADWRREPLTVLAHWWWFFWIGGLVLTFVGVSITVGEVAAEAFRSDVYRTGLLLTVWGFAASTLAGFLGAASVRVIGTRLHSL